MTGDGTFSLRKVRRLTSDVLSDLRKLSGIVMEFPKVMGVPRGLRFRFPVNPIKAAHLISKWMEFSGTFDNILFDVQDLFYPPTLESELAKKKSSIKPVSTRSPGTRFYACLAFSPLTKRPGERYVQHQRSSRDTVRRSPATKDTVMTDIWGMRRTLVTP